MKRLSRNLCAMSVAWLALSASAQELWKYTDKTGKVTYSDKAPVNGEKAERVNADTTGTVIPAAKNLFEGKSQGSASINLRASEREAEREGYRKKMQAARDELEQAKKALEIGQEPMQEERQIVVGRNKDGQPTNVNTVNRRPEYFERIAGLEAAIRRAEEKVAAAEKDYRENAPK